MLLLEAVVPADAISRAKWRRLQADKQSAAPKLARLSNSHAFAQRRSGPSNDGLHPDLCASRKKKCKPEILAYLRKRVVRLPQSHFDFSTVKLRIPPGRSFAHAPDWAEPALALHQAVRFSQFMMSGAEPVERVLF